jgi:hypothetical protein
MPRLHRRQFLQSSAALGLVAAARLTPAADQPRREKLPIAAIVTEYRVNSHADVIVGKILTGFEQDGGPGPDLRVAAMYTDQVPKSDLSRDLAAKHSFPIARTIEEAITLGTGKLAVAGVLSIGEHGDYPYTPDTQQHMYPRRRFFDEIVAAFRKSGQVAPIFNDKHLAYAWADAKHMYDTAKQLKIPFLAGSSVPLAWRVPPLALPLDCEISAALLLGYGGLESYGFHSLEALQCMVERRKGGETGVASVRTVRGEAIHEARRQGFWSEELLEAAAATIPRRRTDLTTFDKDAVFVLIEYRSGLKAAVAMNTGIASEFAFAARIRGESKPQATWIELQDGKPYGHFAYLLKAIEATIHTGKPAYPVERTLLTTGILDAVMHSNAQQDKLQPTPHLDVAYEPVDWPFAPGRPKPPREVP